MTDTQFDAIVVGSGMSGGWVAKELCERGLKVCVLERGTPTDPATDYSDMMEPWERKHFDNLRPEDLAENFGTQGNTYALKQSNRHFWMTDTDQPYEEADGTKFKWRRGATVGGRSLMWGRATWRFAPYDFEVNLEDGEGVDWPVRYDDIAPWYDHVEKFAGISGNRDGLPQIPDGEHFLPPFEHTRAELDFKERIAGKAFPGCHLIVGRYAHLTRPTEEQTALGRGKCQARNRCHHGCSYGAYFSSVSATLPAAERTGNLTLVTNAVVSKLVHDSDSNRITGVQVVDAKTGAGTTYTSRIVFLNASSIGSSLILLNSATEDQPNGLANSSDQVGRNLMDHLGGSLVWAEVPGYRDRYTYGRKPSHAYIPRYRNFPKRDQEGYKRGWGYQVYSGRDGWSGAKPGVGESYKRSNQTPDTWIIMLDAFGEVLPHPDNRVTAHASKTDKWGQPIAVVDFQVRDNDRALMRAAHADAIELFQRAGYTNIRELKKPDDELSAGLGGRIHEMGTARMGRDPKTSVLNGFNQSHDIPNLFITDGSFMGSSAVQNPSLTYMAFSARAANHAADLLEQGAL